MRVSAVLEKDGAGKTSDRLVREDVDNYWQPFILFITRGQFLSYLKG